MGPVIPAKAGIQEFSHPSLDSRGSPIDDAPDPLVGVPLAH